MKHTVKFITLGLICAGLSLAQQRTPADPATMAQRQVERLSQRLSLTSQQQTQATSLFTTSQTSNQSVMTQLRQAHESLATAIKNNDANGISAAANQIGTLTAQITVNNAKADAAFYALLTPDQQSKYTPGAGGFTGAGRPFGGPQRGGRQQ